MGKEEQYKMFVESADKISDKRINQNNIYITLVIALLSFVSATKSEGMYLYIICSIGILISVLWFFTIDNYSKRNKVKYQIINEYEKENNMNWFLEEQKRIAVLPRLTSLEKIIPIVFFVIFIIIMVLS